MKKYIFLVISSLFFLYSCNSEKEAAIDLSGEWQFRIDPADVGEKENWFELNFDENIILPGSMVENGKGYDITLETKWTGGIQNPEWYKDPNYAPYHDPDNIRFPFWLQPEKKYTGAAWYRKEIFIPKDWSGKPVFLKLERPHWESVVWVNSSKVDMQNSLATPHVFNISEFIRKGENSITIRIDNRTKDIDVGENSHSISDHTQSNWNGMIGELTVFAKNTIYFEQVDIFPNAANKAVEIKATVVNTAVEKASVKIPVSA
ncbi:MAG: sugar-binding domain-containing protein [Bacteroidota bacterium]